MQGVLILLRGKVSGLSILFGLCVLLGIQAGVAQAQEMPPFPILYGGRALVDGEPLPKGARLVARVGDYVTPVGVEVEADGFYRGLLVAPLTRDYYYVPITFHAMGLTAEEQDVFLPAGGPTFKDVGFDLHFSRTVAEPSPQPSPALTPTPTPAPAPTPTPARRTYSPERGEDKGFPAVPVAIGAGVVLVALGGWLGLRRRRQR